MKYALTIALLFFLGSSLYCQSHFVGIHGGVNVSRIPAFAGEGSIFGLATGVNYELQFSQIISFQAGLMYNQRGGKFEISLWDQNQQHYTRKYPVSTQHVSLPVTIGLVSKGTTYVSGRMGMMLSYMLDAKLTGPNWEGNRYVDMVIDANYLFNKVNLLLLLECAVGTAISDRLNFEALLSLQAGATSTLAQSAPSRRPSSPSDGITLKTPDYPHMAVAVTVGLKYNFGKKEVE